MEEQLLREVAEAYLLPFFSGARIETAAKASTARHDRVAFVGPTSIAFKIGQDDPYRLVMTRSQPFTLSQKDRVPELRIVQAFVDSVLGMKDVIESAYRADILPSLPRRVIAKSILNGQHESVILEIIDELQGWGDRLYEGSPISATIGLRNTASSDPGISIRDFFHEDFGAVLSNGHDTIAQFNYDGLLLAHSTIDLTKSPASFCPRRQANIAEWTTLHERRLAFSLNRLGEILIFHDHMLLFARRSGSWHFLTHGPTIKQMNVPRNEALRTKMYETCLDVSFARTGGCLGVVQVGGGSAWQDIVADKDRIPTGDSVKTKSISKFIHGKRFQDLDRRVRQELLAIDGATIISHHGDILSVGAILQIDSGSTGGGRTAAAKALSAFGLGVKISQDGGITGYRPAKNAEGILIPGDQAAFKVMGSN